MDAGRVVLYPGGYDDYGRRGWRVPPRGEGACRPGRRAARRPRSAHGLTTAAPRHGTHGASPGPKRRIARRAPGGGAARRGSAASRKGKSRRARRDGQGLEAASSPIPTSTTMTSRARRPSCGITIACGPSSKLTTLATATELGTEACASSSARIDARERALVCAGHGRRLASHVRISRQPQPQLARSSARPRGFLPVAEDASMLIETAPGADHQPDHGRGAQGRQCTPAIMSSSALRPARDPPPR